MFRQRVTALRTACATDLGDPVRWISPGGTRESLALCIIDAIQSTGSHPNSVRNVLDRYRAHRSETADPTADGATTLLRTFDEVGGVAGWAERIGNRKPTSTTANAPLKAAAIRSAAIALADLGLDTASDLRGAAADLRDCARQAWVAIPGQRSGLTWSCLLTLADVREARADRMVVRYVARNLDIPESELIADEAADVIAGVARRLQVDPDALDHAIWRFETHRHVWTDRDEPAA